MYLSWGPTRNREKLLLAVEDDAVVRRLEPLHGVFLVEPVWRSHGSGAPLLVAHVHAGATQHHVKVHAVDTDGGIVLDAQVDVLLDTETEVAVVGKVFAAQLVLQDLEQRRLTSS